MGDNFHHIDHQSSLTSRKLQTKIGPNQIFSKFLKMIKFCAEPPGGPSPVDNFTRGSVKLF